MQENYYNILKIMVNL